MEIKVQTWVSSGVAKWVHGCFFLLFWCWYLHNLRAALAPYHLRINVTFSGALRLFTLLIAGAQHKKHHRSCRGQKLSLRRSTWLRRPQQQTVWKQRMLMGVEVPEFRFGDRDIYQFPNPSYWMQLSPPCSPHKRNPANFFIFPSNFYILSFAKGY